MQSDLAWPPTSPVHATPAALPRAARRRTAALLAFGLIALSGLSSGLAQAADIAGKAGTPAGGDAWQAVWTTAMQSVPPAAHAPSYNLAPAIAGKTVRQVIRTPVAGTHWRLRLSNRYGTTPVTIAAVSLGRAARGAALAGIPSVVTFSGAQTVTLARGEERYSDPIAIALPPGPLAVSLAIGEDVAPPKTWHKLASQIAYVAVGNHAMDTASAAFHAGPTSWLAIDALLVDAPAQNGTIVAIGDSITDGMRSTMNANARWPDRLAERLATEAAAEGGAAPHAVVNMGISGNRLLSDSPCYGAALRTRFEHDALTVPGARDIVVLIGINDINFQAMPPRAGLDCDFPHTKVDAADLIDGYRDLIARAHRAGKRIVGATLTPASLPPEREAIRLAVNRWMLQNAGASGTTGASHFDAVVDFDRALRDPARPSSLLPRYDSGDHVHPSDAGYRAMADALPLRFFAK